MQGRYRNSGDGFRSGSGYRNSNRGGFNRAQNRPYPSQPQQQLQPSRKDEIFMEAGRLAAEYLVSKGLLPPNSLPPKLPNSRFQEFRGQEREPPTPEGRTSALARLGTTSPDMSRGRRRYHDDYDPTGSRNYSRGRRRNGPYGRGYDSEWSRENGRRGQWAERGSRDYPDAVEGEDDFAPGYQRDRRHRFDDIRNSVSRPGADDRFGKRDFMDESGSEGENHEVADDTGSKASSSSTRKEHPFEADLDGSRMGEVKASNSEIGDEVKSVPKVVLEKENIQEEDISNAVEGDPVNEHGDLLEQRSFGKMPTNQQPSLPERSGKVDQDPNTEESSTIEIACLGVPDVIEGEDPPKGFSLDSHMNQPNTSECQAIDISSSLSDQPMVESADTQHDPIQCHLGSEESRMSVDVREEVGFAQHDPIQCHLGSEESRMAVDVREEVSFAQHDNKVEGEKARRDSSPSRVSEESEFSLQSIGADKSSPCVVLTDDEIVEAVDQRKQLVAGGVIFPKVEPDFDVKMEEEKQLLPTSFKICDLNLMGTPEITEIPDDPIQNDLQTSNPVVGTGKDVSDDVGLSIGSTSGTNNYIQLSVDEKVVPVIDLEDDSPIEDNACDSSKLKSDTIYSSLDSFLNQAGSTDIPEIQDGYSLEFSEFLGTDISGCPSVPADLNNLQTGIGLHDAEGVPGNDDSIYVSLGEIPIGFMDVWDQAPQEFGKFF